MTRAERLLVAAGFAFVAAVIGYAAVRALEIAFFPEPSPAVIVWSERSSFVWRAALALYIGGMGAFAGYAAVSAWPLAGARWLSRGILAAALAIGLQGALLP
ncbi:MAG: hypothetical protein HUU21_05035 [Polyangiaceae bacterium]|nr:hypothetical protein [Polyangiaceae bacterium]